MDKRVKYWRYETTADFEEDFLSTRIRDLSEISDYRKDDPPRLVRLKANLTGLTVMLSPTIASGVLAYNISDATLAVPSIAGGLILNFLATKPMIYLGVKAANADITISEWCVNTFNKVSKYISDADRRKLEAELLKLHDLLPEKKKSKEKLTAKFVDGKIVVGGNPNVANDLVLGKDHEERVANALKEIQETLEHYDNLYKNKKKDTIKNSIYNTAYANHLKKLKSKNQALGIYGDEYSALDCIDHKFRELV